MNFPLIIELPYQDPAEVFCHFSDMEWNILLDSANGNKGPHGTSRFSYIAIDPFKRMIFKNNQLLIDEVLETTDDPLLTLQAQAQQYQLNHHPNLPPFQGGVAGFLSYDLCHFYENIPYAKNHNHELEDMAVGFYDLIHAFDHQSQKSWLFSSGLPYKSFPEREKNAKERIEYYLKQIQAEYQHILKPLTISFLHSNFDRETYMQAVSQAIDYIRAGDIFEVNLSQRFALKLPNDFKPYPLYLKIKAINPSPFSAYINIGDTKIISSSPERFIEVSNKKVETRPIKGTRKRSKDPAEDQRLGDELVNSEKDRAENIMIVDLMRNDLSRVCEEHSIHVPQLCGHEIYPHVHHLVSVITGELKSNYDAYDLLKASFPGGSITGAPKIRAMQIISELEPHQRGPYCGSIFFASFDGARMDSSIVIRTYVVRDCTISFHGGGAVTIDSDPAEEYEETLNKINALKNALEIV